MRLPKLLIVGHGRHGKDTLAEILRDRFRLEFVSSSQAAADIFIYDKLKDKYGYKNSIECFEDRANHRAEWYDLICEYNREDKAKLAKGILQRADCYVGMRDDDEIKECLKQELFDLVIWVDASKRLPLEPKDSFNIDISCADIIIENNGTYEEFYEKVLRVGKVLSGMKPMPKLDTEKKISFLELAKSMIIEEEDGFDDTVEFFIDPNEFLGNHYVYGWPNIKSDNGMEQLDTENIYVINIDQNGMTIFCGGDWQEPYLVTIRNRGEYIYVESYEKCLNRPKELSEEEILQKLGIVLS